jgi:hypothetical protein
LVALPPDDPEVFAASAEPAGFFFDTQQPRANNAATEASHVPRPTRIIPLAIPCRLIVSSDSSFLREATLTHSLGQTHAGGSIAARANGSFERLVKHQDTTGRPRRSDWCTYCEAGKGTCSWAEPSAPIRSLRAGSNV